MLLEARATRLARELTAEELAVCILLGYGNGKRCAVLHLLQAADVLERSAPKGITALQLADALDVGKGTSQNYLNALITAGLPIVDCGRDYRGRP